MGCGSSTGKGVTGPTGTNGGKPNLTDKYELGKALGTGSFATCRIGTLKSDMTQRFAIKTLLRSHENFDYDLLQHEITIMKAVGHPRCIRLIEVMEDSQAVHLVEELATGGELFDRILDLGHFSEKDASLVIKQVFEGIAYMHSVGACHRDLKPENLLMVSGNKNSKEYNNVKIADFGLSSLRPVADGDTSMTTVCGTPDYLAPEVISVASGSHSRKSYDSKVDVWAIGVIFYTMLCGYPPFWSENMAEMLHLIRKGSYGFPTPAWDGISQATKDFVTSILQVDPAKRPTAAECLKHSHLTTNFEALPTENIAVNDKLRSYMNSRRARVLGAVKAVARMELMMKASRDSVLALQSARKEKALEEAGDRKSVV